MTFKYDIEFHPKAFKEWKKLAQASENIKLALVQPSFAKFIQKFSELSNQELHTLLKARSQVFVVEQDCVYLDIDGLDEYCWHVRLTNVDNDLMAYCRIIPPTHHPLKLPAIGRVLVLPSHRGQGLARELMQTAIHHCHTHFSSNHNHNRQAIFISAQTYLQNFYQSLGFEAVSDAYNEDGIEHQDMILK